MTVIGRKVLMLGTAAVATLALAGCIMEPRYTRPEAPVAQEWPDGDAAQGSTAAVDIGWRDYFTDQRLQKLIELALLHNPDARSALLNITAARDQYRIQRADLFPSINASAIEQVEKYPATVAALAAGGTTGGGAGGGTTPATSVGTGSGGVTRYFDVGVGFTSYELDLFGKIRSLNKSRLQQYLGYLETRRSTQLSVIAEVASAYLTWQADQHLLKITQDTLKSQQDSLDLIQMGVNGGVQTALDLHQAETTVATAQANLAQYTRQVAQDRNALVVLIGTPLPDDLPPGVQLDDQKLLADLPAGVPSTVLAQRPDVLAAEHNLLAANANIGAARAAFFPSVSLTGSYGTASTQLSGLFDKGSTAWTFSPQISIPIFAGGANAANLDLAHVQKNLQIVQYEQSIQNAFREVADALAGRATLDDQIAADERLLTATSESYRLSNMRFTAGVDNYLAVLDSQRLLYTAQQSLVNVKLARLQNLVTLYKALGGGWQEHAQGSAATAATPGT